MKHSVSGYKQTGNLTKKYHTPWYSILMLMFMGGLLLYFAIPLFTNKGVSLSEQLYFVVLWLIFTPLFLGYGFYLWRKRIQGKGIYWDEEGVVIDLKGNKIYWNEIEDIRLIKGPPLYIMKETVIYPHYTKHEEIRARHNKIMPKTAHSINWFFIESAHKMHGKLKRDWKDDRKVTY
ncbi:hypothetical protein [Halobacillus sp. A5]|uniref:hypothetical protein n=1 Tax=Halobacillus sp. A5 TaxID=2880263 RepID=UPI0020A6574D|nr:hypothetical protein [Halobacillus sp. A5]MCP3027735.1 hypothetical protein [Halobacillus sp. A5]